MPPRIVARPAPRPLLETRTAIGGMLLALIVAAQWFVSLPV